MSASVSGAFRYAGKRQQPLGEFFPLRVLVEVAEICLAWGVEQAQHQRTGATVERPELCERASLETRTRKLV